MFLLILSKTIVLDAEPPVEGPPSPFPSKTNVTHPKATVIAAPSPFAGPAPISKPSDIPFQPGQTSVIQSKVNVLVSKIKSRQIQVNKDILLLNTGGSASRTIVLLRIKRNKGYIADWERQLIALKITLSRRFR